MAAPADALALDAPAKVNLYLAVGPRRADGFHAVETVLQALTLHDTLFAARTGVEAGVDLCVVADEVTGGLPVAAGADNLVSRAARAFLAASGVGGGFCFHLVKRIPAGGGLGGGSSDAAAALLLANALCGDCLPASHLHELAAGLGSDVPFFLRGGTQLGCGRGEQLTPLLRAPHYHFVLLLPPGGTSTRAVYEHGAARQAFSPLKIAADRVLDLPAGFRNDLEPAVLELYPELADLRREVVAGGFPGVAMSGSGSTFFLAHKDEMESADAMDTLAPLRDRGICLVQARSDPVLQGGPWSADFPGPG